MMNKEIKKKWIKALESGKYKQTRNRLKSQRGYCCLGVLCDLYCKEKKEGIEVIANRHLVLPSRVVEWAGVPDCNPDINLPSGKRSSLGTMNDRKYNFKQIAKVIKEQL